MDGIKLVVSELDEILLQGTLRKEKVEIMAILKNSLH